MVFQKGRSYIGLTVLTVLLILTLYVCVLPASAAGGNIVSVSTPAQPVNPGQQFTVNITVQPESAIAGAQFDLSFNPSLVSVNNITEGNLFNQDGASAYFMPGTIDNTAGTITGVAGAITTPGQTVSKAGIFAVITMTAGAASGTCSLNLSNVIVGDINGQPLSVSATNGQVIINSGTTTTTITTTTTPKSIPTTTTTTLPVTTTTSITPSPSGGGGGGGGPQDLTIAMGVTGLNPSSAIQLNLLGKTRELNDLSFANGMGSIKILAGTAMLDRFGKPLTTFSVYKMDQLPDPPDNKTLLFGYEFGPAGAHFNPVITITLKYDPKVLPAGTDAANLEVAYWNGTSWESVSTTVDTDLNTITFSTYHFSTFAVLYPAKITLTGTKAPNIETTTTTPVTTPVPAAISTPTPVATETPSPVSTPASTSTPAPAEVLTPLSSEAITTATPAEVAPATGSPVTTSMATPVKITTFRLSLLIITLGIAVLVIVTVVIILVRRSKLIRRG